MGRLPSYPKELRERAVRIDTIAVNSVGPETQRKWVRRAEIDSGQRPGLTTEDSEQIKALRRENAEVRRANEILKSGVGGSRCRAPTPRRPSNGDEGGFLPGRMRGERCILVPEASKPCLRSPAGRQPPVRPAGQVGCPVG